MNQVTHFSDDDAPAHMSLPVELSIGRADRWASPVQAYMGGP